MSTITASSTLDEIRQEYVANASYEEDDSTTKAAAFITAARALLVMLPRVTIGHGGDSEVQFDVALIKLDLESARTWLGGRVTGSVRHVDFRDFRF